MSQLVVSPSPHIRGGSTTPGIMRDVLIALLPACVASVLIFGIRALLVIAVCTVSCVVFEWAYEKLVGRVNTVRDLSACVTGVLLAYNLPVSIPIWQAVVGSAIAIVLVKQLFGGIGKNFANPAITARIFMLLAFSGTMATWVMPSAAVDGVTSATPLVAPEAFDLLTLFLGKHGGSLGEVSAAALLLGLAYLLIRRVISWETPVIFVGVVFVLSAAFGSNPVREILSGGLLLGAIFMTTDYVTSPTTFKGRVVFAIGAGFLTVVIRQYGSYPEGVSFAILLMNILTPYINRFTRNTPMGAPAPKKRFRSPIIVLVLICIVISGALAFTNEFTRPIIDSASGGRAGEAMRELIPAADEFLPIALTDEMLELGVTELYDAKSGGEDIGYIAVSTADGYGGKDSIVIMVAVGLDHSVVNIRTLVNNETPGLGSRVSEPAFENTFIGSNASFASYDAISGATISSTAYFNAVDHALQACSAVTLERGGFVS